MSVAIKPRFDLAERFADILGCRPEMDQERLAFGASVYFSLFCNTPFWGAAPVQAALHGPGGVLLAASLFVAMTALCMLLLCLFSTRWTAKPLLAVMFAVTAASVYFTSRYSVYIDAEMVRNVLTRMPRRRASWSLLRCSDTWHCWLARRRCSCGVCASGAGRCGRRSRHACFTCRVRY